MTTELINQFRDFEIFAEKMEALVEAVKNDEENKKNKWGINQFDLRDDNIGMVGSMPKTLKDYLNLWEYVQQRYKEYLENYKNPLMPCEMFFDVYWNDTEANSAFYDGLTLWIYFDYEYGIYYDTDVEICDKIRERDD